ncbi:MAG: glycosyltransferase [Candidatus ainarchaeum sp.]|nr:glycosyltransferase [Candidatus ainarchaeum sp.]MDD5096073.1 glycosyltransferase [Candidatus ainarchaeum sp.]
MKIAYFTDTYLPNVDGVVTFLLAYRAELEKRGHEVYIFTPGSKRDKAENKDKRVYYFTSASFKPYPDYRISLFPFLSAVKLAKEIKPDIIHSHGIATTGLAAIQCAQKLRVPAIASFHTMAPEATHYLTKNEGMQKFLEDVAWKYLKWYYASFEPVLAPSGYTADILKAHGIGNVQVLPSGIDSKSFAKADGEAVRKRHGLGKKKVILHAGRMVMEKNLDLLIDEAQSIINKQPNARFMLVGKGPAEEHYKARVQAKGLGDYFIFTGFVDGKELPDYYAAADVFAFPSKFDTQGLVVLEAMASGTPAVVPTKSAAAELIEEGKTGYSFTEPVDFREKVLLAMERKDEMGKAAREAARKYDKEIMVGKLEDLYKAKVEANNSKANAAKNGKNGKEKK